MGRKSGSYKFEKRQKELKKQKKKQEKLNRRMKKGSDSSDEPQPTGWEGGPFRGVGDAAPDTETKEEDDS